MGKLNGQVAIVTGASGEVGAAVAEALALEGAAVVLAARRKDRLLELAARIEAAGGRARACQTDTTSEDDVVCLFHAANNEFARLDLVVNCVGAADATPLDQISLARWREMVDVTLTSAFLCAREALRVMKLQKSGRIVNVAIAAARAPAGNSLVQSAAASAIEGLTNATALEGGPFGIAATFLHPGSRRAATAPHPAGLPAGSPRDAREIAAAVVRMAAAPSAGIVDGE
jgi:NAD(P)-dependent dehydrogenase (short-subunit alcohol dehydrogenase family)